MIIQYGYTFTFFLENTFVGTIKMLNQYKSLYKSFIYLKDHQETEVMELQVQTSVM